MPKRRFKRKGKKRVFRRKRMTMRKSINMPNSDRHFSCIIEASSGINLAGGAGGLIFTPFNVMLNYPTMMINAAGTKGQLSNLLGNPFSNTNIGPVWSRLLGANAIFDEYRVVKLSVRFVPQSVSTNTSVTNYPTVEQPEIMYVFHDYDDNTILANEAQALNDGIYGRSMARGKEITYNMYAKKYQAVQGPNQWYNTSNYTIPVIDINNQGTPLPINSLGCLKFGMLFTLTAGANNYVGHLYFKWHCVFRGIRETAGL